MSDAVSVPDAAERSRALDPTRSCIVQAPAGSGKTELLIQRFLALLARVDRPEEIAAITFTIKAAGEMRHRIVEALRRARDETPPASPHEARTWQLARAALERNDARGWKLEESAERLRVQTIDALCASLTRQMPVVSGFGAQPETVEDASALYREAARGLLAALEDDGEDVARDIAALLLHLDNDAAGAEALLAAMLERRDHWIRTVMKAPDRARLEQALADVRAAAVRAAVARWPRSLPAPDASNVDAWIAHAKQCLTDKGQWRSRAAAPDAARRDEALRLALCKVKELPPARYTESQWRILEALVRLTPRAVAELQLVFAARRKADFIEVSQAALRALGDESEPTDLMLALDYRIRHVLVDEFQDTSFSQFELLEKLTSGWEAGDGRTLFLVGDPMQSIYRFREAEVGLFLEAWHGGIGSVRLEPLTLAANFRSHAGIVDWVNATFARVMPQAEDIATGAVSYAPSQAIRDRGPAAVTVHPFFDGDAAAEAGAVVRIADEALKDPHATVAILVRNRSHLEAIMPRLREAKLPFRAIEIEPLGHRPVVQDLLALTRALSHLADRVAWLAVLRAPWCGLTLDDLVAVAGNASPATVWEAMQAVDLATPLSGDGRERLERVRAVLSRSLRDRARSTLRAAVEGAWLTLGGPACVEGETDLEDAAIFLDHLEASEEAGALADLAAFELSLAQLFALPDVAGSERLQVMTIHRAKGLEFDTVIVPGLGAGTGRDDRKLFLWMETPERKLLLAPINPAGADDDPIYEFIRGLDKEKAEHECGRLLYVAATRARDRLHLMGDVKVADDGAPKAPSKGSLLAKLWPVLGGDFHAPAQRRAAAKPPAVAPALLDALRRLVPASPRYTLPPPAAWRGPPELALEEPVEFSWVGDTARRVGSVVHRWLQRIAEEEARGWDRARVASARGRILNELAARGIGEAELPAAAERVVAALVGALEDERGRWLLGPQREARNEHRISAVIEGRTWHLVIDRMFEDADGNAWIVDYKTSSHEGADLEGFLAREEERYAPQLARYAQACGRADARRALYFPLLRGWRVTS